MNLDAPFGADQTPEVPAGPVGLQWTTMAGKGQKSGYFTKIMHEYVERGEIGGLLTCNGKSADRAGMTGFPGPFGWSGGDCRPGRPG